MDFDDMNDQTRWLVMHWERPTEEGQRGHWKAWTSIQKLAYWAVYNVLAQGSVPRDIETLIMAHALPPNIMPSIISNPEPVPGSHWFSLINAQNSPIGVYPQEISEKEFLLRLEKLVTPKSEIKAA